MRGFVLRPLRSLVHSRPLSQKEPVTNPKITYDLKEVLDKMTKSINDKIETTRSGLDAKISSMDAKISGFVFQVGAFAAISSLIIGIGVKACFDYIMRQSEESKEK